MRGRLASLGLALVILVALIGGWKIYVEWFDVSPFVLPPPEDVAVATLDLLTDADTWHHLWVTTSEILGGFALAVVFGVLIGVLIAELPLLDRALTPYLVALLVLPKVAVIPLLVLWLGFGSSTKIVVAAIFALFPIVAGTRAGIRAVDVGHRDLATSLGAAPRQRLALIELPSALPSILTGMEVGMVLATIGAIVAEYLAGSEGLGWLAVVSLNQLQVDTLFGVIVLLSVLGLVLYAAIAAVRRRVVPWHPSAWTDARP